MTEIVEGLFLGSFGEASDQTWLESHGITHILNMAKELPEYFPGAYGYKKIPLQDEETCRITKYFPDIVNFTDACLEGGGKILVHCMLGVSRSATAVILYLMERRNYSCIGARQFIKEKRRFVRPNNGFVTQLINHELLQNKNKKSHQPMTKARKEHLLSTKPSLKTKISSSITLTKIPKTKPLENENQNEIGSKSQIKSLENKWKKHSNKIMAKNIHNKGIMCAKLALSVNNFSYHDRSASERSPRGRVSYHGSPRVPQAIITPRRYTAPNAFQSESKPGSLRTIQKLKTPVHEVYSTHSSVDHKAEAILEIEKAMNSTTKITKDEKIEFFNCRNTMESVPKVGLGKPKKKLGLFKMDFLDNKIAKEFGIDQVKLKFKGIQGTSSTTKTKKFKVSSETKICNIISKASIKTTNFLKAKSDHYCNQNINTGTSTNISISKKHEKSSRISSNGLFKPCIKSRNAVGEKMHIKISSPDIERKLDKSLNTQAWMSQLLKKTGNSSKPAKEPQNTSLNRLTSLKRSSTGAVPNQKTSITHSKDSTHLLIENNYSETTPTKP